MRESKAIEEYLVTGRRSPYMVETYGVPDGVRELYPACIHVDGTCRPQTVSEEDNPGFWKIIKEVGDRTGHYLVLNTSFNMHGEPIVCSPGDAINTFRQGCADYLALGSFLLAAPDDSQRK